MKAKDLRGKNIEDIEDVNRADSGEDEDAVSAAYENISKRLESIRGGNEVKDSEEKEEPQQEKQEEEIELQEWKGPRKPTKEDLVEIEEEEDTLELRKVKLRNLEEPKDKKEEEEDEEEIDPLDDEDGEEESRIKNQESSKEEWQPDKNDPLDDEDEEDMDPAKASLEKEEETDETQEEKRSAFGGNSRDDEDEAGEEETAFESDNLELPSRDRRESEVSDMPRDLDSFESKASVEESNDEPNSVEDSRGEPDSLDDLADEKPQRTISDMGEDDYFIPKLKASGQREGELGYNAHPQRAVGDSYAPRHNNMEGNNDPNSYFSQHQPQAPKRANKFHLLILVLIGIAVIGFTVYILKGGFGELNIGSTASPSPSPVLESTPVPTPTPTPEPDIEKGNFSVKVLNGTTTSGLAKTISDKLKGEGYKTAGTGNASDDDVAQTEIRVKEGTESAALFESLKSDLAPDYQATQGDNLSKSATYDAEVIIGAK